MESFRLHPEKSQKRFPDNVEKKPEIEVYDNKSQKVKEQIISLFNKDFTSIGQTVKIFFHVKYYSRF